MAARRETAWSAAAFSVFKMERPDLGLRKGGLAILAEFCESTCM